MRQWREAQMSGDGLPHVGKAVPAAQGLAADARAKEQHRYMLPRMVRAPKGWIATVIGGDQGQIAGPQAG